MIDIHDIGKRYAIGGVTHGTLWESVVHKLANYRRHPTPSSAASAAQSFWALRNVSFEVAEGEVVGIIGRNGAGKSTLLKILSRITRPTEGRIRLRGRVASLLEVGTGFHPELSGRENIYLNGAILGMSRRQLARNFDEIVAFTNVEKFIDTPVKHYSSGMHVRLGFAIAAHLDPEILIVDEVLAVGDLEFQKKCMGKISDIAQSGRTIVFVSHDIGAVRRLCSRCVYLDQGGIVEVGEVEKVVAEYIGKNSGSNGDAVFDLDTARTVSIHRVWIENAERDVTASLQVEKSFNFYLRIVVHRAVKTMQIGLAITAPDGQVIFVTTSTDESSNCSVIAEPGEYEFRVRIPGGFLNVGTYGCNVRVFGIDGVARQDLDSRFNVLTFNVEETGSIASRFRDRRGGYVTPSLVWDVPTVRHPTP